MEAGNALTDVLSGKANPSGKLPATFPVKLVDSPSYANFPSSDGNPNLVNYKEDIYVGYRYYSTFNVKPAYEFGYGLSYTTFDYSDFKLNKDNLSNKIKVQFKVTNSGSLAGKEAPQLYVSAPDGKLEKPAIELKAFGKTRELKPGQKRRLTSLLIQRILLHLMSLLPLGLLKKVPINSRLERHLPISEGR